MSAQIFEERKIPKRPAQSSSDRNVEIEKAWTPYRFIRRQKEGRTPMFFYVTSFHLTFIHCHCHF